MTFFSLVLQSKEKLHAIRHRNRNAKQEAKNQSICKSKSGIPKKMPLAELQKVAIKVIRGNFFFKKKTQNTLENMSILLRLNTPKNFKSGIPL